VLRRQLSQKLTDRHSCILGAAHDFGMLGLVDSQADYSVTRP